MDYRVEDKYLVSDAYIELIKARLDEIMNRDAHSIDGSYLIRSLYFDDFKDSLLNDVEDGVDNRCKLRLRIYNNDASYISYEKKSKVKGFTHKESINIDRRLANQMISVADTFAAATVAIDIDASTHPLIKQYIAETQMRLMHPVAIVEYERIAFIEPVGNVRITIDKNISGSNAVASFFDECIEAYPVLPTGMHILEVKYDEILPEYIKKTIDIGHLSRTSYSKYYMARRNPQL